MTSVTADGEEIDSTRSSSQDLAASRLGPGSLLVLSAWCGLVAGLLEVGTTVLRKQSFDLNRLSWKSRHFLWLIPTVNLSIFLGVGLVLSALVWSRPRRGGWLAARLLGALTVLPPLWAAFPQVYGPAGFLLALGFAARFVPWLERQPAGFRRTVRFTFPVLAPLVPILAGSLWGGDRLQVWRAEGRPFPAAGSPNILLVVLDTVGAEHLGLHGYRRPTSPTLDDLAGQGIRFDRAQATASWTLPSHAGMFTGRWPHELSAGWFTPLDRTHPTLAEYLGARGYATAGFVANAWYCGSDSGLARGFTVYRDYVFPRLTAWSSTVLVDRPMEGIQAIERFLEDRLDFDLLSPAVDRLWRWLKNHRKETAAVNGEFLDWLSRRRQPDRPFFAFLNYYDAHYPYEVPEGGIHRFGVRPRNPREATVIRDWLMLAQKGPSPQQIDFARDSYDDCVADVDEQLGRLIDELERRSVLERTWVIITSDHGESFGEQPGVFWHGTSLHQSQLHVPLVILPPAGTFPPRVVRETVSLRDLPATVVEFLGVQAGSPFPGASLSRFFRGSSPEASIQNAGRGQALAEVIPLQTFGPDPSQWLTRSRWPLAALTEADWSYIRQEGEVREELFHLREDARERRNLAGVPAVQPTLERMRHDLGRFTDGPLTPQRFNP